MPAQLNELQGVLKDWNKKTFGNIFATKRSLMKKFQRIDRDLKRWWNDQLINLRKHTWKVYEATLAKEELLWFHKSRSKWLEFGDMNTKYFHGIIVVRRRKNHISTLQNDQGN